MANKAVSIPITDEETLEGCTQYYVVKWKGQGTDIWNTMSPNPIRQPIVIEHLYAGGLYDVEITRICCNGLTSTAATMVIEVPA